MQAKFDKTIKELEQKKDLDQAEWIGQYEMAKKAGQQCITQAIERLRQDRDRQEKIDQREEAKTIRNVQDSYKLWGVLLPPAAAGRGVLCVLQSPRQGTRRGEQGPSAVLMEPCRLRNRASEDSNC